MTNTEIRALLRDPDSTVRSLADWILERRGARRLRPYLTTAGSDPAPLERQLAGILAAR